MTIAMTIATESLTIDQLAEQIKVEVVALDGSIRHTMSHAKRIGELLCQAKERLERGKFGPWLAENFAFSERTAQNYMKFAKCDPQLIAGKTIPEVIKMLAKKKDKPAAAETVTETTAAAATVESSSVTGSVQSGFFSASSSEMVPPVVQGEMVPPVPVVIDQGDELLSARITHLMAKHGIKGSVDAMLCLLADLGVPQSNLAALAA